MIEDESWRTGCPPGVFGTWDAPATDDLPIIDPPVDRKCIWCKEQIKPNDNGCITLSGFVEHRECCMRQALGGIGHLVDHVRYCKSDYGPDAGLTHRQSSLLVWDYLQVTNLRPTPQQVITWRLMVDKMRDHPEELAPPE